MTVTPITTLPAHDASAAGVHSPNLMDLSPDKLKAARKRLGLTQAEVANMLDPVASWRTVASWEKGDFKPKSPRREQLAQILQLDSSESGADIPQIGGVGMPRHELVQALLRMRSEVDSLISRL